MEHLGGTCVLLVEDNDDNRAVYETILRHYGCDVVTAVNGAEGVEKASLARPDLILMDIQMPVMDGLSAARALKACASTASFPIVILTAHIKEEDRQMAREIGCEGFLLKPCPPRDVLAEVLRVCSRKATTAPAC